MSASLPPGSIPPIELVLMQFGQLINYCRVTLNMKEMEIQQLWQVSFQQSLVDLAKAKSPPVVS